MAKYGKALFNLDKSEVVAIDTALAQRGIAAEHRVLRVDCGAGADVVWRWDESDNTKLTRRMLPGTLMSRTYVIDEYWDTCDADEEWVTVESKKEE